MRPSDGDQGARAERGDRGRAGGGRSQQIRPLPRGTCGGLWGRDRGESGRLLWLKSVVDRPKKKEREWAGCYCCPRDFGLTKPVECICCIVCRVLELLAGRSERSATYAGSIGERARWGERETNEERRVTSEVNVSICPSSGKNALV